MSNKYTLIVGIILGLWIYFTVGIVYDAIVFEAQTKNAIENTNLTLANKAQSDTIKYLKFKLSTLKSINHE